MAVRALATLRNIAVKLRQPCDRHGFARVNITVDDRGNVLCCACMCTVRQISFCSVQERRRTKRESKRERARERERESVDAQMREPILGSVCLSK